MCIRFKQTHYQKDIHREDKHMKRCSASLVIRGIQIKTTMRYYYSPIRMVKMEKTDHTKC